MKAQPARMQFKQRTTEIAHKKQSAINSVFSWSRLFLLLLGVQAAAATNYVWQDSPNPTPPYSSWDTAAHVIQDAVDAASDGDTLLVTNGVYLPVEVDKQMDLVSVGGPVVTVIDGLGVSRCVSLVTNASMTGFTLTNGWADIGGGAQGGALTNCVLTGNRADHGGGAYDCILSNCTLTNNWAWALDEGSGGAASRSSLYNCAVTGNHASALWGPFYNTAGGGIYLSTAYTCTLTGNWAGDGGGAYDSTLYDCVLTSNSAWKGFETGLGGGAYECVLNSCILRGNGATSTVGGGAAGSILNNCILIGNEALDGGGARGSTLNNCILVGNSATRAGGGAVFSTLNNCTVTGNSAVSDYQHPAFGVGGGVVGSGLSNCVVYYNNASSGANYHPHWVEGVRFDYSCTYPMPTNGIGNITNAPLFVDTNNWADLRPRPDSPCIDAGNNDFLTGLTDLDGNPRILNGIVDMGAYEFVPLSPADLVQRLIDAVNDSDLRHKQPLLTTLNAALASIERGNHNSATSQLGAFQNKVGAQVAKHDAALAVELIEGAEEILAMLEHNGSRKMAGKIHSLKRHPNGKMQMKIKGEAGKAYTLEASTNLVDWMPICVVRPDENGDCDYEDLLSDKHPCRFYRLVEP